MHPRMLVLVTLALSALLVLGACSDDEAPSDSSSTVPANPDSTAGDATTTTTPPADGPSVRLANLNLLHGLPLGNCPEETTGCEAATRLDIVADEIEAADCPEILTFQEVGPYQQEDIPTMLETLCDGVYSLVSEKPALPVEQWIVSSLPVVSTHGELISGISRSIQVVVLEGPTGPINVATSHYAAGSVDNLPCNEELCTDYCEGEILAGDCNAMETVTIIDEVTDPSLPTLFAGDLNTVPGSARLQTLLDAGFVDSWLAAGNPECTTETPEGCTCCVGGDGPFGGLDDPGPHFDERIDYILFRPGVGCDGSLDAVAFANTATREARDGVYWAADHGGLLATLTLC